MPEAHDLVIFNTELSEATSQSEIIVESDEFDWNWTGSEGELEHVLCPIVDDTARLFTSKDRFRVKQDCLTLLYDKKLS